MRRTTLVAGVAVALLAITLLVNCGARAQSPVTPPPPTAGSTSPTVVPVRPLPTRQPSVESVAERSDSGISLKAMFSKVIDLFTKKEQRGSTIVDILISLLTKQKEGLESFVDKFTEGDFFMPKFSGGVWEILFTNFNNMTFWLLGLALPLVFMSFLAPSRGMWLVMATWVAFWFLGLAIQLLGVNLWQKLAEIFRWITLSFFDGWSIPDQVRSVIDNLFNTYTRDALGNPLAFFIEMGFLVGSFVWIVAAGVRYGVAYFSLVIRSIFYSVMVAIQLFARRPAKVKATSYEILVAFGFVVIFWAVALAALLILASLGGLTCLAIGPMAFLQWYLPKKLTSELFSNLAQEMTHEPKRKRRSSGGRFKGVNVGRVANTVADVSAALVNLRQEKEIKTEQGVNAAQQAQLDEIQSRLNGLGSGGSGESSSPSGVSPQPPVGPSAPPASPAVSPMGSVPSAPVSGSGNQASDPQRADAQGETVYVGGAQVPPIQQVAIAQGQEPRPASSPSPSQAATAARKAKKGKLGRAVRAAAPFLARVGLKNPEATAGAIGKAASSVGSAVAAHPVAAAAVVAAAATIGATVVVAKDVHGTVTLPGKAAQPFRDQEERNHAAAARRRVVPLSEDEEVDKAL